MIFSALVGVAVTLTLAAPARADTADQAKIQTVLDLQATPHTLDQAHPSAAVSGKVTDQATGNPVPNAPVNLGANGGSVNATAVTDQAGEFTATYTVNTRPYVDDSAHTVSAYVYETDEFLPSDSKVVVFTVNTTPTRLTLTADRSKADYGQPIKLSGTLTASGAAVSGKTVTITPSPDYPASCNVYDTAPVTASVRSDGTFSTTVKPRCGVLSYTASLTAQGWYEQASATTGGTRIRQAVDIQIGPAITKDGNVNVSGSIHERYAFGSFKGRTILLQYSPGSYAKASGKWTTKKTLKIQYDNSFHYSFPHFNQSGYWRAQIAASGNTLAATSPVKKAWRWNTHFAGVKLSTKKTTFRHKLTIGGQLIRSVATNHGNSYKQIGFAKQRVQIGFTCNNRKNVWYTDNGWVTTDSHGRFKKTIRAYCTGKMFVIYWGGSDTYRTDSKNLPITVKG
ncbi:carboxypeptidase-like regulatory domain-containing protein [Planotetraspora silvatica]|nr:carboxypeptidase-like regulatory domain-containing protein [Planotetraspora silvatica]